MACKRGRGGARHTPKPFTDEGVLLKVLGDHKELVKDLGAYESITAGLGGWTQGVFCDAKIFCKTC